MRSTNDKHLTIAGYKAEVGVNCVLSSISNAIAYFKDTINDSVIYFTNDNFKFTYSIENLKSISQITLDCNVICAARDFLQKSGIAHSSDTFGKPGLYELKNEIFDSISSQRPYILAMETAFFNHNAVYRNNIRRHHVINVIGIEASGFIISDCYVPTVPVSCYEGLMDFETFMSSWTCANRKVISIDFDKLINTDFCITMEGFAAGLKTNIKSYVKNEEDIRSKNNLYSFANHVSSFTEIFSVDEIKQSIHELSFKIQHESIIPARKLLQKALFNLNESKKFYIDTGLIDEWSALINRWHNITFLVVKGKFKTDKEHFKKVSDTMKSIIEDEMSVLYKITQNI